jgi:hypothetical protein
MICLLSSSEAFWKACIEVGEGLLSGNVVFGWSHQCLLYFESFLIKYLNAYIFESPCCIFPFSNTIVIMEHHWLSILKGKRKVFTGYWLSDD